MFDLENAIADWRRQMIAGEIKSPKVLSELESHLREDIKQQRKSGWSEQKAFENSVQRIGQPEILKREFKKTERALMKRSSIMICTGIVGLLVGMAFVMPAIAQYWHNGAMAASEVALLLLGVVLASGGAGAAVTGLKKRRV
jgi:hypothetical protein